MTPSLEIIKTQVTDLYKFRDEFFTTHETSEASKKNEYVKDRLNKALIIIEGEKDNVGADEKGEVHFLTGRALNVLPDYSAAAETELGKATKFNLPSAWNELGECLYKKNDLTGAKTCFERAISLEEKSIYFINMSMLMRSLPTKDNKQREENINKGLEYARDGLKRDMNSGHAWLVLGNAYLSAFFTVDNRLEVLKNCKAAYSKAELDKLAVLLPELHYSKYQVQWYEEEYNDALGSIYRAHELEPSWHECQSGYQDSWKFLSSLSHLSRSHGQLNQRRLNNLIADIKPNQLGPYEKGGTSITDNKQPSLVTINQLCIGPNQDKIVQGKVVCTVIPDKGIPFAFCFVDKESSCIAVTVYNWDTSCGVKIGDSIAIVAPVLKQHKITAKHSASDVLEFKSIRVVVPVMLVVNKRRITASQVATSKIVSCSKQE